MKKIATLIALFLTLAACSEDVDDNAVAETNANVSFKFTHNWNDQLLDSSNFENLDLTNENGEVINIDRVRYLISRIELINTDNNLSYVFDGYKFTDLSNEDTYDFSPETNVVPLGNYQLKFIWGFNEQDNINGAYPDLNTASWNWPDMLGGGYHFLQFDGMYNVNTTNPAPFNYHNGTARVSEGVFEQNFATITFSESFTISNNATIEVKMNIAQFFTNPNTWDLNVLDTPLMPNYTAQKMMQENVLSVFSLGEIIQ